MQPKSAPPPQSLTPKGPERMEAGPSRSPEVKFESQVTHFEPLQTKQVQKRRASPGPSSTELRKRKKESSVWAGPLNPSGPKKPFLERALSPETSSG